MCWTESGLCTRDGWLKADPQRSQFHPTNLFLSLNLWCKDLVPQKRGKGNAVSVLNVLATGLSLCAEQRVDFVQEMGDKELTHKGVSFTQQISSLVSICDAKTWSHKKEEKKKQWVCWLFWPLDCLFALNRGWLCTRDGWLRIDRQQGQFHPTNLLLGLNLWCKDLSYKKEEKETKWAC